MIVGVDEAGRGALAGPVVAAAVALHADQPSLEGLADSKALSATRRTQLAAMIHAQAQAVSVAVVAPARIDAINILRASLEAMAQAVDRLGAAPAMVLVDGNQLPDWDWPARAVVGGDHIEPAIMAASIIAKVSRDAIMEDMDARFPGYGFARHKGYPTVQHQQALATLGACPTHRHSFAPVRRLMVVGREPA